MNTDARPTGQPLDLDAVRRSFDHYREHQGDSWARRWSCCSAHGPADYVPALFAELKRLQDRLDVVRALATAASASIGIGCLSSVEDDDGGLVCDGRCGGHRTTGWTLDPAAVLRALDGES